MHLNLRWAIFIAVVLAISAFGFSLLEPSSGDTVSASAVLTDISGDTSGYARAFTPLEWQFPQDFGAHEDYQTEWWYYTGNLADETGRRFGYQFTIFRRAIAPAMPAGESEWRTNQLYMAHFAVTDVEGGEFYHEQRFSRAGAGLAGAEIDPLYRVWLEDWQVIALEETAEVTRITAAMGDVTVDFMLMQVKPPALQGEDGLSAKSEEPGNASHYYSLSRLVTEGTINIDGAVFSVSGASWKDHEFSTSALGSNALGWDWFGLQFDDNREMMIGQIRLIDGGRDPYFGGLLIQPDGSTRYLPAESFTIEATATWTSPHTGAEYPAGWRMTVDIGEDEPLRFTATPQLADQELTGGDIAYWEGTVRIDGDVTGYGYAELTGYVDAMTGRF